MEYVSGNILIRPMAFGKAGQVVMGHAHNFDHTTYVVRGALRIESLKLLAPAVLAENGDVIEEAEYETIKSVAKKASDGHNWVLIKAGVHHRITALEDGSLGHCIYSHRTPQAEIVQEWDGWEAAYV